MKKSICFLLAVLFSVIALGQIHPDRYRMKDVFIIHNDDDGEYLYHEDWKEVDILLVMDTEKKKITLYGNNKELVYEMISVQNKMSGENVIFKVKTIDIGGGKTNISFITIKNELSGFHNFVKIEFKEVTMIYRYIDEDGK